MTNIRKILYHRTWPMVLDISDAITNLVARDGEGIPLALTIEQIAEELVRLSTIDDAGDITPLPTSAYIAVLDKFTNYLMTSTAFKGGYKHYENVSDTQVVPVTAFFFKSVYTDEARSCLDAMTSYEIKKSLPGRPSLLTNADKTLVDEDDDDVTNRSGRTVGIAVFPKNAKVMVGPGAYCPPLVKVWLKRSALILDGSADAFVKRAVRADTVSSPIERLRISTARTRQDILDAIPEDPPTGDPAA